MAKTEVVPAVGIGKLLQQPSKYGSLATKKIVENISETTKYPQAQKKDLRPKEKLGIWYSTINADHGKCTTSSGHDYPIPDLFCNDRQEVIPQS